MDIEQFVQRIMDLYPRIIRGFTRQESNYLSRGEITVPQFWALEHLNRSHAGTMSELARFLKTSRAASTGLIDRLIAQGMVARTSDAQDRRIVRIEITAKGRKIIENINKQKQKALIRIFSKISLGDRKEYLNILEQIVKIVNEP